MNQPTQIAKAETFRRLHDGSKLLVLPNAWDVASARLYEAAGFRLIHQAPHHSFGKDLVEQSWSLEL